MAALFLQFLALFFTAQSCFFSATSGAGSNPTQPKGDSGSISHHQCEDRMRCGFLVYRTYYNSTDEEWNETEAAFFREATGFQNSTFERNAFRRDYRLRPECATLKWICDAERFRGAPFQTTRKYVSS
jgi:hypothetical protein